MKLGHTPRRKRPVTLNHQRRRNQQAFRSLLVESLESRQLLAITPLQIHVYDGTSAEITTADTARGSSVTVAPTNPLGANWKAPYFTNDTTLLASLGSNGTGQFYNYNTVPNARPVPLPGGGDSYAVFITGKVRIDNTTNPGNQWVFGLLADDDARIRLDLDGDGILEGSIANGVAPPGTTGETVVARTNGCCAVTLGTPITIPNGEYLIEMVYTEGGGGDYGEFFYAPAPGGVAPAFSTANYALIGDGSKGISIDLNNPPTISNIDGDALSYTPGVSGAVVIDQATVATVVDPPPAGTNGWNGGNLTVSITAGGVAADDVLSILSEGAGPGQIGFAAGVVSYEGTAIGTAVGGAGGSNLVVTFNSAATTTAVSALINNFTFLNGNANTLPTARQVRFTATDGNGQTSAPSTALINMNVGGPVAIYVWDGTGDGTSFSVAANWVGDAGVPDANDIAIFRDADSGPVNLGGTVYVGEIRFDGTGSYDLQGGTLYVNTIDQQATATGTNEISAQIASTALDGRISASTLRITNSTNAASLIGGKWVVNPGATLVGTINNTLGPNVQLNGGTARIDGQATFAPGLLETVYNVNNIDNPTAGGVVAGPTLFAGPRAGVTAGTAQPWTFIGDNETIVYRGQFFDADGIFAFAEQIDDGTLILIDGVQVLRDTTWNVAAATGRLVRTPGWHDIEIRLLMAVVVLVPKHKELVGRPRRVLA